MNAAVAGTPSTPAYPITGPEAVTFDDAARILSDAAGVAIRHVRVSQDDVRNALRELTGDEVMADAIAALHGVYAAGREATVTETIRELTGRDPRRLADFARDHADALGRLAPPAA